MANYNLGQAEGTIVINYDGKGVTQAQRDLSGLEKQASSTGKTTQKSAGNIQSSIDKAANAAGAIGLGAAAGLAAIVHTTANFDKAMSAVQAATHESASNMELLRTAAINAGQSTVYSASESAGAIEELAKAGVSTKDILGGGLTGALNLAAAGAMGVGDAAEIAASAMTQFGLTGDKVPHIADLLAAAAGKAQGSVQDLGYAMKYVGVPANALGVSIEETTGVLGEFASAGITGSQAGTLLRGVMLRMAAPTARAQKEMDKYNIQIYDAQGNFVGMQGAAEQLQKRLGPLSQQEREHALSVIFGQEAIQGAIQLYKGGGDAVQEWTDKVNDDGYAAQTAAARLNNLSGDIEQLSGAFETAMIKTGDSSQGPLRQIVQGLTAVVNAYNSLPGIVQSDIATVLAVTAGLGAAVFVFAKVAKQIQEVRAAMVAMQAAGGMSARSVTLFSGALKGLGIAGAAVGALQVSGMFFTAIQKKIIETLPGVNELTSALIQLGDTGDVSALPEQFDDLGESIDRVFNRGDLETAGDAMSSFFGVTSKSMKEAQNEISAIDESLAQLATQGGTAKAQAAFDQLTKATGLSTDQIGDLQRHLPQFNEAMAANANTTALAGDAATGAAGDVSSLGKAAARTAEQVKAADEAARKTANQFITLGDSLDDSHKSLQQWMADMRKQAAALNNFTDNSIRAANKGLRQGLIAALQDAGPEGALRMKQLANATKAQIREANRSWAAGQEAIGRYVKVVDSVPTSKSTKLNVQTGDAIGEVQRLRDLMDGMHDKTVNLIVNRATKGIPARATGGLLTGPGTGTSDSILMYGSNGEYMMRAAAVREYGVDLMNMINAQKFADGGQIVSALAGQGSATPVRVGAGASSGPMRVRGALQIDPSLLHAVIDGHIEDSDDYGDSLGRMNGR